MYKRQEFAYDKIYGMDEGSLKTRLVYDTVVALFDEYKANCSLNYDPQPPTSLAQHQASTKQPMKAATRRYANISNMFLFNLYPYQKLLNTCCPFGLFNVVQFIYLFILLSQDFD